MDLICKHLALFLNVPFSVLIAFHSFIVANSIQFICLHLRVEEIGVTYLAILLPPDLLTGAVRASSYGGDYFKVIEG